MSKKKQETDDPKMDAPSDATPDPLADATTEPPETSGAPDYGSAVAELLACIEGVRAEMAGIRRELLVLQGMAMASGAATSVALAQDEVAAIMEKDPGAKFRVLRPWKHVGTKFAEGRVVEGRLYRAFLSWIGAGLKVSYIAPE